MKRPETHVPHISPSADNSPPSTTTEPQPSHVRESSDFVTARARMLCVRQMGIFSQHPGLQFSTLPSSVCQSLVHSDRGSKDGYCCRKLSGSTPRLKSSGKSTYTAGLNAQNSPPRQQDTSGGAFILQLVKGNAASLASGGSDSFQQPRSRGGMGAAVLRQVRGEPNPGIPSEGMSTYGPVYDAGDEAAQRSKALLMQLFSPGIGSGGKGGPLTTEPGKNVNSTSRTKAANYLRAKKHTAMSETKGGLVVQEWSAGDDKAARKAYTHSKIRVNASTAAGIEGNGLATGRSCGGNRQQREAAGSWDGEWKLVAVQTWEKTGRKARRIRGERRTCGWNGGEPPSTAQ